MKKIRWSPTHPLSTALLCLVGRRFQKQGKEREKPLRTKNSSTAPKKTKKNPKNKAWRADQVELLLRYVKDFKTKCDFNGIDFEADLASMYTEISSKVTVKSHSIEMLQREQIIKGKEH